MGPLHKKLLRTVRDQWGQSLAIVAVVACGVAAYVCFYSCYLNLLLTRDLYYSQQRYAHFEIMLDRAPANAVFRVEELEGVRRARGRIVKDISLELAEVDEPRTGRLVSMPEPRREVLNDIVVVAGEYFTPGAMEEVILSESFATANNLSVGDRIEVNIEQRQYSLRIVGLGLSPEYVYIIRNIQELIPSPERFGILWVPDRFAESALNLEAACNNIVGYADEPEHLDGLFDRIESELEAYGVFAKLDRDDMISHRFLADEIQSLGVTARIMPIIFLGVAAMILFILLNRMVRMERTQIGLLKAFGYSHTAVALHYVQYGLLLSMAGCLVGFLFGQWMANSLIRVYVQYYQFPVLESRVYPEALIRSMGSTILFSLIGAVSAALRAAAIQPAEAMRPEAPLAAHKTLLEYFPRLWARVTFTGKLILRNLERNRTRAAVAIIGVALSCALLVMGYAMLDGFNYMLDFQYKEVQREDARIAFQREHGRDTLYDVARFPHVRRAEPILEYPFTLRAQWREKDAVLTGLEAGGELRRLVNVDREEIALDNQGLILADKLAAELQVRPGDWVELEPLMGRLDKKVSLPVSRITQQYLGSGAYLEIGKLSRILDESFTMNAVLLRIDEGAEASLKRHIKDIADIASTGFAQESLQSLRDTLAQNMEVMNLTMLLFSGIIAFSIIYNITSVALAERERELASLRVLGLTTQEVGRIMYYENLFLGALGIVAGLPAGHYLTRWIFTFFDTDLFRMPFYIDTQTYAIGVLITALFVLLANIAVWRKVQRLDMIEALKERE